MRINLTTSYDERHAAKALGARWDAFKRCWYVIDPPDLTPFLRWIPAVSGFDLNRPTAPADIPHYKKPVPGRPQQRSYGITTSVAVTHCGCEALPWEDCAHTSRH